MASFGVYCGRGTGSTLAMCNDKETIAWWPCTCTPPTNLETFSEKISASTVSRKQLVGLLKKMNNNYDDRKIVKSCMSDFSPGELKARIESVGISIARCGPVDNC